MALLRLGHKRQYGSHRLSVDGIAGGINIEVSEHAERAGARSSPTVRDRLQGKPGTCWNVRKSRECPRTL